MRAWVIGTLACLGLAAAGACAATDSADATPLADTAPLADAGPDAAPGPDAARDAETAPPPPTLSRNADGSATVAHAGRELYTLLRVEALVDPGWAESYDAHAQWLLGPALLLARVVTEGATTVTAALPEGRWEHLFTGESFEGRQVVTVAAPLGRPAAFVRAGAEPAVVAAIRAL